MSASATRPETSDRRRFPRLKEDIGEDPARTLDYEYSRNKEEIQARIRGIDFKEVCRAWIAVERQLGRGSNGGPRQKVLDQLEARLEWLEEHGDRDERIDFEAIRERQRRRREQAAEDELEEAPTRFQHEDCGGDVERRGRLAYYCASCEKSVPQSAVLEVLEA